jgi:hypothetical protein
MDKISISGTNEDYINDIEKMILRKLKGDRDTFIDQTSHEDLVRAMTEASKSSLFESALGGLIMRNSISRIGNDHYQITEKGISEIIS